MFCNIVPVTLLQNLPLATRATFWFLSLCSIRKKCCVASASKNVTRVVLALRSAPKTTISESANLYRIYCNMQFLWNFLLSHQIYPNFYTRPQMLWEIIGDLPIVPNNHKFLAKFHSDILRITDPMRLMSLFSIITWTSIRICLKCFSLNL